MPFTPLKKNNSGGKNTKFTLEDVRDLIKNTSVFDLKDIEWIRWKDNKIQWNAVGGLSVVTHDSTLSGDGTVANPLRVVGGGGGSGTVTSVSIVTANGISGSVATSTTTPAITLTLGAITPTSVVASGNIQSTAGIIKGQYANANGTAFINPDGSAVFGGGVLVITNSGSISGSNLSGTNTGDQTISLTGDITGSGTGSFATTLATVNSNVGTFTNPSVTVNAKGLITSISNGSASGITRSVSSISTNTTAGANALTDYVYFTTAALTLTLPSATGNTNRYTVINNSTGTIIVAGTINGSTNDSLFSQYETAVYVSNGTNWFKEI